MQLKHILIVLLSLAMFSVASADPKEDFAAANAAAKAKDYQKALVLYKKVLEEAPTNSTLWNAGSCAYLSGDGELAAKYWNQLKSSDPLDVGARSKLIQAYALLKDDAKLKREREELLALQKEKPELFERSVFCREQFKVGETQVMAYESYKMEGPRGVRYIFYVLQDDGKLDYRVSLGSYDATNAISQEMRNLPKDVRVFHLDGYFNGGRSHTTYDFYEGEPPYKSIRSKIVQIVSGKAKALSSSGPKR